MKNNFFVRFKNLSNYRSNVIQSLDSYLSLHDNCLSRGTNFTLNSLHYFYRKFLKSRPELVPLNVPPEEVTFYQAAQILENRFPNARKLNCFLGSDTERALNLVTDSIGPESLFGGVATSLILATEFCNKFNLALRIVTRNSISNPLDYYNVLDFFEITPPKKVSFATDCGDQPLPFEISIDDVFLATSWWSAYAIRKSFPSKNFFYLIQEVETFFYPHGDEHLMCKSIEDDANIKFIVNSHYLYDYFKKYSRLGEDTVYFEPAFSKKYKRNTNKIDFQHNDGEKRKIFFYARPNNPRNLFYTGLSLLDEAVSRGVIDTNEWDIYTAGSLNCPQISLSNGYKIKDKGVMTLDEYSEFLKAIDVTFSLMYTPHPSYPPYDALSAGAIVLTNRFENKSSFDFSKNAIFFDLNDKDSYFESMKKALFLATDPISRFENYQNTSISADWGRNLEKVLLFMEQHYENK